MSNKKQIFKEELNTNTFLKKVHNLEKERIRIFDEVMNSNDPELIIKAQRYFNPTDRGNVLGIEMRSMLTDPLDYASSYGYKEKPTRLTYDMLRRMASTPFTALTINTRIAQVSKFCNQQEDEYDVGFKIKLKQKDKKPDNNELKRADELTEFILNCGATKNRWGMDDFETFVSKLVRDSLTFDQYTYEVMENGKGMPQEFIATDASTYRLYVPKNKEVNIKRDPLTGQRCTPFYVQVYNGNVENTFYPWELCFGIRRPRTDLRLAGYGFAELEELVNIITSMLWSDEYNRRFFSQGSAPKGIIRVSGQGIDEAKLKEFKRQWMAQMAGVYNSWKTPIMDAEKMEWIDLSRSNRDMEYSSWQEYLIKLHSALFLIDPSELGWDISRGGNGNPMFESNNESRIKYSRDKGLVPILRNIQKNINKHIINRIDDRFEFVFVGIDTINADQDLERSIKELTNYKNIDEIRAKFDLKPLGEEQGGNLILNANWMSWYNNKLIREQQKEDEQQQEGDGDNPFLDNESEYDPTEEDDGDEVEKSNKNEFNPFVEDLNQFLNNLKK